MSKTHENFLLEVEKIIRHQKEKEQLRGEKFNVFSILKLESKENTTHSAFLSELLNPKGSHLRGSIFLELFVNYLSNQFQNDFLTAFDYQNASVSTEHYIGPRNDQTKTGGRIDLFIKDQNNRSLSIENKIYASDQFGQIERYVNYNSTQNLVFYLTLWGNKPSFESAGTLTENDYYCISYKKHIVEWLSLCMKEVHDYPILRETIKQYILLLKKLTYTMNNDEENELLNLLLKNYEAATYVSSNLTKAMNRLNNRLREALFRTFEERLSSIYSLYKGGSVDSTYSQIWIKIKGYEEGKLFFGIQNFTSQKISNDRLHVGIFVCNGAYKDSYQNLGEKRNNWWIAYTPVDDFEGFSINLNDPQTLKRIVSDEEFFKKLVHHIADFTVNYVESHKSNLQSILQPN